MTTEIKERRQHQRFKIENSVLVSSDGIYQITAIGIGGFCFRCSPNSAIPDFWEIDILTPIIQLRSYPAQRVWVSTLDIGIHDYLPIFVGAKFGRLKKDQTAHLFQLIETLSQLKISEQQSLSCLSD